MDNGPITAVYTDACDTAVGDYCDCFYCKWSTDYPEMRDLHIHVKELAAQQWGSLWANKHVLIRADNCGMCNPWFFTEPAHNEAFEISFSCQLHLSISITCPVDNVLADKIPCLYEPYSVYYLYGLLKASPLVWHMSYNWYSYILDRSSTTGRLPRHS